MGRLLTGRMGSSKRRSNLFSWFRNRSDSSFDPAAYGTPVLWLKADAIQGLSDTDPVATWEDSHTSGNDATQGTAGSRPTYQTNEINGLPVVRFDGTDDQLVTPSINLSATDEATIFAVLRQPTPTTGSVVEFSNDAYINDDAFFFYVDGTIVASLYGGLSNEFRTTATYTNNEAIVVSCRFDKGLSSGESRAWLNGDGAGSNVPNEDNTNAFGTYPIYIGGSSATEGRFTGDIGEVIVYNSALSDSDRQAVEAYLADKWGITLA